MPKISAKNSIILLNGYNFSTYTTQYEATQDNGMIDVTGFTDGGQNVIPGQKSATINMDMLWDSTASVGTAAVLAAHPTGEVTIIPAGYTVGTESLSMPYVSGMYAPSGNPTSAITIGGLVLQGYGSTFRGLELGWMLQHATITNTTTSTPVLDPTDAAVTAVSGATLHIWTACASDTYVVKVQHCATIAGVYADLVTFVLDGSAIGVERQVIASGTVNKYRRVLATRTGAAGDSFGFSVAFWHGG